MLPLIHLYRLCDSNGVCHYVGQTATPVKRKRKHLATYPYLTFELLRSCSVENAQRLETQIIRAHWKQGQAKLNTNRSGQGVAYRIGLNYRNRPVLWEETGHVFPSIPSAAKFFGLIPDTVKGWMFNGLKADEGITLKLFQRIQLTP